MSEVYAANIIIDLFAMTLPSLHHFFFLSTLVIILVTVHSQCLHDQKTLLHQFKSELKFNSYLPIFFMWKDGDCCHWDGVECDGVGRVIGLRLDRKAIRGGLDESSSLFRLRYLQKLNLAYNSFNSQIPRQIHLLTYLRHLNLSYAGFEGQIPSELSLLNNLITLDLSTNSIDTPSALKLEHPSLKMVIQNLTKLTTLYLDGVDISAGGSEWGQAISSSLPQLRVLSLRRCNLLGPFHASLSQLHSLSVLQFDGNNLSTTVPYFFADFSSLTTFSCSSCYLEGYFPEMIFQVPTLQELNLSSNYLLNGTIPGFSLSRAIRSIDIHSCSFSGQIPSLFSNLTELSFLVLSNNSLSGLIPSFCMSKKIKTILLNNNNLSGSLYNSHFECLSNLVNLSLAHNSLQGNIPISLFGLSSLELLDLSNNQFSGQIEQFPIANNSNMRTLDLSANQLEGPIPESFFQYPMLTDLALSNNLFNRFPNLSHNLLVRATPFETVDLSNNKIVGDIPSWIWERTGRSLNLSCNLLENLQKPYHIPTSLETLDLHSNRLRGELPPLSEGVVHVDYSNNEFGNTIQPTFFANGIHSLRFLFLANNSLSGTIPTSITRALNLQVLDLSSNNLSSISPHLLHIMNLELLNLRGNYINGVIPDQFPTICMLKVLDLSDNHLSGTIPKSISNCFFLEVINVGNNNFDDSFPCMLPSSLRVLILRSNKLHGELRCDKSWPSLQIVDISSNNFSGTLHPLNFSSWRGMMLDGNLSASDYIRVSSNFQQKVGVVLTLVNFYYQVKVTLTVKGAEVNLTKIWSEFTSIDFSNNNFQGDIPEALGNLTMLYHLNLSHNAFTSAIPKSLGALTKLEVLDFSVNHLRGRIPEELAQLTFLSFLNVSFNDFVGMIPKGRQFQTFSAESFEGNPGLCGFPLNTSCSRTHGSGSTPPNVKDEEIEWEYVCGVVGYVVGMGSIVWLLLFCRSFRERYFEKIEEVFEKIFEPRRRRGRRVVRRNHVRRRQ